MDQRLHTRDYSYLYLYLYLYENIVSLKNKKHIELFYMMEQSLTLIILII